MWRSLVILLAIPLLAHGEQPAEAVLLAAKDIQRVPNADRYLIRYLWVSEGDEKQRQQTYQVTSALANFLSRNARIVPAIAVFEDGTTARWPLVEKAPWSKLKLIRFRIADYGWDPAVWERLGDPALEPLFHVVTVVPYAAGKYKDGSSYPAGEQKVQALAPWLLKPLAGDPKGEAVAEEVYSKALYDLIKETGYSQVPILEAQNWVWQTAIQSDRKAGYYDFLGVKDKKTFDRLVGFDEKTALDFRQPQLEAVAASGVAVQPRRIEIWPKLDGKYILTKDQVNQRATGNRNPLITLGRNDLRFDATEVFAQLPSGLWAFLLANDKGVLQNSAPDGVGYFHQSPTNNGKIEINLTCLACHDGKAGNGGMQPFRPYFRQLYKEPGKVALGAQRFYQLQELSDQYLTPIDLEGDQRRYEKALFQACGLKPHEYSQALLTTFHSWERPVTRSRAAQLYGVTEKDMVAALGKYLVDYGKLDEVNANWLLDEPSMIGIDQFAEAYNLGQLALRGLPTWPAELRKRYPTRPR